MKTWCAGSALIIAAIALLNVVETVRRVPPIRRMTTTLTENIVMRHEQRLARVRPALEKHGVRGPIGYVADLAPDELAADPRGMEEYFLSQFVLVPWVLDARMGECHWAVANLHVTKPADRLPSGFRVAENFGAGVLLLEKVTP